jgi:RHS repeat-associated protein
LIGGRRRKLQALPCEGITYPGTGNNSQFAYDGRSQTVKIVETVSGTITGTKQFIWCGDKMCEARDSTGGLLNQYFGYGQTISVSNYFYTRDHLGSVRELADSSGNFQAQYNYDSYGRVSQLQGSLASDFQYADYYFHAPSGLNLTRTRAYRASLGRFLDRDLIAEAGGINLYQYVKNDPTEFTDPAGTDGKDPNAPPCISSSKDCAKWCKDTSNTISDPAARAAWFVACIKRCNVRFPLKPPVTEPGGYMKPGSWVGPPGYGFMPPAFQPPPLWIWLIPFLIPFPGNPLYFGI